MMCRLILLLPHKVAAATCKLQNSSYFNLQNSKKIHGNIIMQFCDALLSALNRLIHFQTDDATQLT